MQGLPCVFLHDKDFKLASLAEVSSVVLSHTFVGLSSLLSPIEF
jgi:cytochrome c oxidase assembly protein Cox11